MADRFEQLYKLPDNLYAEGSPIIISAGALLKDTVSGKIIAQFKFHSVTSSIIKALKLSLSAYDVSGAEIQGVEDYQYLDLSVRNGVEFGSNKAIVMPDPVTRSFAISKISVVMSDGTVADISAPFSALPKKVRLQSELNNTELVKQYKIATNSSALYVPQESNHLWMCACGEWNSADRCTKCHLQKNVAFSSYDVVLLTEAMNIRLNKEKKEKEEQELLEKSKQEEDARLLEIKKAKQSVLIKRIKVSLAIATPLISAILIFSLWVYPDIIVPANDYKHAEQLLLDGNFTEAAIAFQNLGDYKNASQMVDESLYQKASKFLKEKEYVEACNIFKTLDKYKDSKQQSQECLYCIGKDHIENKENKDAILTFNDIIKYKDSKELLKELYDKDQNAFIKFSEKFIKDMPQDDVFKITGDNLYENNSLNLSDKMCYQYRNDYYTLGLYHLGYRDSLKFYFEETSSKSDYVLSEIEWRCAIDGYENQIYDELYNYMCLYFGEPDSKEGSFTKWGNKELFVSQRDFDNKVVICLEIEY